MTKILPSAWEPVKPEAQPSASTAPASAEPRFKIPARAGMLIGLIGILMAFGHSILAMSRQESLAQVNRELEYPQHKNLMRPSFVIFFFSLLFSSSVSFFLYYIIPPHPL